jgi:hypothetical protein
MAKDPLFSSVQRAGSLGNASKLVHSAAQPIEAGYASLTPSCTHHQKRGCSTTPRDILLRSVTDWSTIPPKSSIMASEQTKRGRTVFWRLSPSADKHTLLHAATGHRPYFMHLARPPRESKCWAGISAHAHLPSPRRVRLLTLPSVPVATPSAGGSALRPRRPPEPAASKHQLIR